MDITRNSSCRNYERQDGMPEPESRFSCRGCKHSADPRLYDSGCLHPDGFQERPQATENRHRKAAGRTRDKLSSSEQRRVDELIKRANEAHRDGKIPGAEYR